MKQILVYSFDLPYSTCPPVPPVQCGCGKIFAGLNLDGVAKVKSTVGTYIELREESHEPPFDTIIYDSTKGENIKVWRYVYQFSYDDSILLDQNNTLAMCDLSGDFCCYDCKLKVVDNWLKKYVKGVTGVLTPDTNKPVVDNSDPQNPVVYEHLTSSSQNVTTGDLTDTNEAGTPVVRKIRSSVAGNIITTGSDGGNYLSCAAVQGCIPAPAPYTGGCGISVASGVISVTDNGNLPGVATGSVPGAGTSSLANLGDSQTAIATTTLTNDSCKPVVFELDSLARRYGRITGPDPLTIGLSTGIDIGDGLGFTNAEYIKRLTHPSGTNARADDNMTFKRFTNVVAPGTSITVSAYSNAEMLSTASDPASSYDFDSPPTAVDVFLFYKPIYI